MDEVREEPEEEEPEQLEEEEKEKEQEKEEKKEDEKMIELQELEKEEEKDDSEVNMSMREEEITVEMMLKCIESYKRGDKITFRKFYHQIDETSKVIVRRHVFEDGGRKKGVHNES